MSILIKDVSILSMETDAKNNLKPIFHGDIGIKEQNIAEIGANIESDGYDTIVNGHQMLAMPGFVNTHGHIAMTLLRGYGDDLELMTWLEQKIWPLEDKMTGNDIYVGAKLGIAEMIKSGTTTFNDMYFFMDSVAKAVDETGIRAVLGEAILDPKCNKGKNKAKICRQFISKWYGYGDGRININIAPHAIYTCPPAYMPVVMDLADDYKLPIQLHLSETLAEVKDAVALYGKSPVQIFEEIGLFDNRKIIAAHSVHVDDRDLDIISKHHIGVAHNPVSNMKLGSGIAPVSKMLAKGITVALGTDGAASNNNLDMFEEMRTASFLQKVATMNPQVLPAAQVLQMATVNGAEVLGLEQLGGLAVGKKADMILIDLDKPHLYPQHNLVSHLVYSAQGADVDTVIINGQIVMKNRELLTIDEEKLFFEVKVATESLLSKK